MTKEERWNKYFKEHPEELRRTPSEEKAEAAHQRRLARLESRKATMAQIRKLRYEHGLTLEEIAKRQNPPITRERVRQLLLAIESYGDIRTA